MTVKLTDAQKIKILNGEDVYGVMQRILLREKKIDRGKEHVWVIALASSNRILNIELVGLGSTRAVVIEPVDVFSFALNKQATKIILVHNHPSGDLTPSPADLLLTSQMISVGDLVRCELIDHLIISEERYFSFKESGDLKKLKRNATDLNFKELKKAQALAKLRDEQLEQTARALLQEGFELAKVAQITGLTEEQVAALTSKP